MLSDGARLEGFLSVAGRPYTNHELKFIKENYGPMSAAEVGKALGRSREAIVCTVNRYGIKARFEPKGTSADRQKIMHLISIGKSTTHIAEAIGMSKSTVALQIRSMPKWFRDRSRRNGRRETNKGLRSHRLRAVEAEAKLKELQDSTKVLIQALRKADIIYGGEDVQDAEIKLNKILKNQEVTQL